MVVTLPDMVLAVVVVSVLPSLEAPSPHRIALGESLFAVDSLLGAGSHTESARATGRQKQDVEFRSARMASNHRLGVSLSSRSYPW
ncbi:hypothetical protein BKA80DRAFT_22477 [Phyllosticta citrichinensis]